MAHPDGDVSNPGEWYPTTGDDLWPMVDEDFADDDDWIRSPVLPVNAACTMSLEDVDVPIAGTITMKIRGHWI